MGKRINLRLGLCHTSKHATSLMGPPPRRASGRIILCHKWLPPGDVDFNCRLQELRMFGWLSTRSGSGRCWGLRDYIER